MSTVLHKLTIAIFFIMLSWTLYGQDETSPSATDDNYTVTEGSTLDIPAPGVLLNDTDPDDDILSASQVTLPAHSPGFHLNNDGSFAYQHDGTPSSTDIFTYVANDGTSASNEASVIITIEPVNDAPVIEGLTGQTIDEGGTFQPIPLDDLVSDEEDPDNSLEWNSSGNNQLSVIIDESSHVAIISAPETDWHGTESITFEVSDSQKATDSETAIFTVNEVAAAPVAQNDEYSINEGGMLSISAPGVVSNDTYDGSDALMAYVVTEPSFDDNFNLNTDGSFTYTHNGHETGDDHFTYYITDGVLSSNTATVAIKVSPVNDAPVINDLSAATLNYTEGGNPVKLLPLVSISDIDDLTLESAVIDIDGGLQSAQDLLEFENEPGISGTYDPGTGVLSLSGTASKNRYINALRSVTYRNSSERPSTTSRAIKVLVSDAGPENASSNTVNKMVSITSVNDVPVLGDVEGTAMNYTEGSGPVPVTGTITVTDVDNTSLESATIQVLSNYQSNQDVLAFANANGITGSWNATNGTLTLTGMATLEIYQTALRSVTYENTSATPFTPARSISFTVFDGTGTSNMVTRNLTITPVDGTPVLTDPFATPVSYTENGASVQITNSITAQDDGNLSSATVSITANFQSTEDVLSFTPSGGATGNYNTTTGVFSITGTTTVENYTSMLRSIRYLNGSESPAGTNRSIAFRVFDGSGNGSNTITKTVNIITVNDNPVLAAIEGSALSYTEGGAPVNITGSLTVTDIDNPNLASASVRITSNYMNDQDVLSFSNAYGITGSWNATNGEITLTGNASFNSYQTALRTVKYNNTSLNPGTNQRTVTFTVSDGLLSSNSVTRNISVSNTDNEPVLSDVITAPVTYTEGGAAVRITNTVTISDDDNTTLASAKIAITNGLKNSEDVLSFVPATGITGSYNATSGELNLTGNASLANYQTVLRSIRYANTNVDNPDTTDRVLTFTVNDGTSNSNALNKTVVVKPVNDPPVASAVTIVSLGNKIGTLFTGSFTFTDPDEDEEGTHKYQWYRSDFSGGEPFTVIPGATGKTYRTTKADGGKWVGFEVIPADEHNLYGTAVKSAFTYVNAAPVASNVYISATDPKPGSTIEARFTYSDKESNPQGTSLYYWFRSNTATPTPASPGTAIGTNSEDYQIKSADAGKYIWFRVHPVATTGSTPGDSVWSNVIGPIGDYTANITGSDTFCTGLSMPITLTITSGRSPYTAILHRAGTLAKDTTITNILTSPRIINVKIPGTYTLTKLTDDTGDTARVAASLPVKLVVNPKSKAIILGSASICNDGHSLATLSLDFLSGVSPWQVTIRRTDNTSTDTIMNDITNDPHLFNGRVIGGNSTRYRVISIKDANGCPGDTASGSAWVTYRTSPLAEIEGNDTICPGSPGTLKVTLKTGLLPWSFTYLRNGGTPVTVSNISTYEHTLTLTQTGVYTISEVRDLSNLVGCGSGAGNIVTYTVPTGVISGNISLCEHTTGNLSVSFTGKPQWRFSYRINGGTSVEVDNITISPYSLPVQEAGTYTLFEVYDQKCKGTVSGGALVTVTPAPEVTISGLDPAYDIKSTDIIPIIGTPEGGVFSGPGVYGSVFIPKLAPVGTHNIVYTYRASPASCYGYDTATVSILEADAIINFENDRLKFCQNDKPFYITGINLKGVVGTFSISGGKGLYNVGDNTALIKPAELEVNKYTVTYTYIVENKPLSVPKDFDVGKKINTAFTWATECYHAGQPIKFINNTESPFGYLTDTSFIWIVPVVNGSITDTIKNLDFTFTEPGDYNIKLVAQNTYGCVDTLSRTVTLRPTIELKDNNFIETFENTPLYWKSGSMGTVNSWRLGSPTASANGFDSPFDGQKCWYTNITSVPAPTEQSYVTSPCFDFTGVDKPMLSMQIWRIFNSNRDGANVQATTDSAKTWNDIGEIRDGINWYNSYDIRGNPGNSKLGWSNNGLSWNDADWTEARHSLDMLKDKSEVQFRIAYGSADAPQNNEGIAFDNFSIMERTRMALVERFTNSNLTKSAVVDEQLDEIIQDYQSNIIDIQYHTSYPGGDPFFEQNPAIPTARQFYYGISGAPYAVINGGTKPEHRFDTTFNINAAVIASLSDAKFEININSDLNNNILNAQAIIQARTNIDEIIELSARMVVIERIVTGITGANGDTLFRNVVRTMIPAADGITENRRWNILEKIEAGGEWEIPEGINQEELRIIAFVQNESTKEVYQASISAIGDGTGIEEDPVLPGKKWSFIVYPNPSSYITHVQFVEELDEPLLLQVFNNQGSLVYSENLPEGTVSAEIPVEQYPQGLYLLRFTSGQKMLSTSKLIISR